jgi:hypothetical protein
VAIALLVEWVRRKIDEALIERKLKAEGPKMQSALEKLASKITELQNKGKVFARITIDVVYDYGQSTEGSAYGMPIVGFDRLAGASFVSLDVAGESEPPLQQEREERLPGGIQRMHYLQTYSTLIDDPEKRAREKEQTKLRERLNRLAEQQRRSEKAAGKPAQPAPPVASTQPAPLITPPGMIAPPAPPDLLPGAPGEGPLEKAARWVKNAETVGWQLVTRGTALEDRLGGSGPPTQEERTAFLRDELQWRSAVKYQLNWSIDNAPSKAVQDLKQLLEDPTRPGPKLDRIRVHLGGGS